MGRRRHEIDEEDGGSFRQKGYMQPMGPLHPPPPLVVKEERRRFIFLVPCIVMACIAALVVTMYFNDCPKNIDRLNRGLKRSDRCVLRWLHRFSFQPLRENPLLGPSGRTLRKVGGLMRDLVVHKHQGWRLVSCLWLHAGVFHLVANMVALLLIGLRLEQEFGFIRVGIVYLVSGFGGSLLSALFVEYEVSVGASGALFGLLGATMSELITNWTIYANKCLALFSLIVIVAINLGFGLMPHVDNFAHIGGFVGGFLLGFVFLVKPQYGWVNLRKVPMDFRDEDMPSSKYTKTQYALWIIAAILLVACYGAAAVALFTGVNANKKCSWCHYLSCVETSAWRCNTSNSTSSGA